MDGKWYTEFDKQIFVPSLLIFTTYDPPKFTDFYI